MKRLVLLLPLLALPLPAFMASPIGAQINENLIAQRGSDWDDDEEEEDRTIRVDTNIKGIDPKHLLFNEIISTQLKPNTKVLYDRQTEGDMCFMTCNFYNGVTSQWSDFFVDLQPFENFCLSTAGCASQYPTPSDLITLTVDDASFDLRMTDLSRNRYYLPLVTRRALAQNQGSVVIEIRGVKKPIYRLGKKNLELVKMVVNTSKELPDFLYGSQSSKKGYLLEIKDLLENGFIDSSEYDKLRKKSLGL